MPSRVSCVSETLLIIDGHSMAFRAFYALPADTFVTHTGQHTNAVYGFTTMLLRLLEAKQPNMVAVAFDLPGGSFRNEEYPEYKGTRDATPEEFIGQVELIEQVLDAMGIVSLTKEGYEADDILATLAHRGARDGHRVFVVSGDRDSFQTVTDTVTVLYPGQRAGDLKEMTPEAVEEKYGVPPRRYPEIAALVGETSDNLPGVPGVGPKTAAQWINTYDGLDNVLANAHAIGGKRGEALREHTEDVLRNRRLNRLLTDVDLDVEVTDLRRQATDMTRIEELFDTLEFSSLRSRVRSASSIGVTDSAQTLQAEEEDNEDFFAEVTVSVADEATSLRSWLGDKHEVALWVEGRKQAALGHVSDLVFATREETLIIDPADVTPAQDEELAQILADPVAALAGDSPAFIVHQWKGTSHALRSRGWTLGGATFDVQLAAYLAHPEQRSYDVSDLARRLLNVEFGDEAEQSDALFEADDLDIPVGPTKHQEGAARKGVVLMYLWEKLSQTLEKSEETGLLTDIEMPLSQVLGDMEDIGIAVDSAHLESMAEELGRAVDEARHAAWDVLGHEVNLSSPKQLQEVLFDELGLPPTKKNKRGYTTNAEALQSLWVKTVDTGGPGHEFLEHLLTHRDRIKLKQMVDGLIATVQPDGRIHTTFSQVAAATGRLASSEPNLQNIPARTADGMRIRGGFVAGPGFDALMSADYSQIEMRIMADLSEDRGLIDAFNSGEDLHRTMASMVFDTPVDQVTGEQRSRIKATSYGLAYGLSSYGLSQQLRIPVAEASALKDRYFERFAGVRDYLDSLVAQAKRTGYTETMFGRRRYLPDLRSSNRQRREMAERAALNAPIQGSAADIIKIAMIRVVDALHEAGLRSRVLVQIHDELLIELVAAERERVERIVREEMASAVSMAVSLDVAVGVGRSWQEAAH
ncbi:DNA polymerase I [Schaalia sp. ZJ1691]|uniref:DNA polymerase I n=1 Tax=Schaalia sp. ZJ1691 TaxID=2709404 RepID=UPI00197D2D91|nr:DNA polymerase I [Schaalia sp. ZJ1691]